MNELESAIRIGRKNAVNKTPANFKKISPDQETVDKTTDRVSLSKTAKVQASLKGNTGSASEIRQDLVNRFRSVLNDGTYEVKADEIADKIVQKIKEHKNRTIF